MRDQVKIGISSARADQLKAVAAAKGFPTMAAYLDDVIVNEVKALGLKNTTANSFSATVRSGRVVVKAFTLPVLKFSVSAAGELGSRMVEIVNDGGQVTASTEDGKVVRFDRWGRGFRFGLMDGTMFLSVGLTFSRATEIAIEVVAAAARADAAAMAKARCPRGLGFGAVLGRSAQQM